MGWNEMTVPIVAQEGKAALKIVEKIGKILDTLKRSATKESEVLSLRLPDHTGEYSVVLRVKSGYYGGKIAFSIPNIIRLQAVCLPAFRREEAAVSREGDTFLFDPGKLSTGAETVLLKFLFQIEERTVFENLVKLNSQLDPLGSDSSAEDKYWLTAQIKFPASLQKIYRSLEVLGVDFRVDVGVNQQIKTVPSEIRAIIERPDVFSGTADREKLLRLVGEQRRAAKFASRFREDFRELALLFMPTRFSRYIVVQQPFRYTECEPGLELFESSFAPLPKFMTITSRTDLSLEEPAKEGVLVYKKKEVKDEIQRIFPASKDYKSSAS